MLLAVAIAGSGRSRDLSFKAKHYAQFGVREYWVIEAEILTTIVHEQPSATGYASIVEVPPDANPSTHYRKSLARPIVGDRAPARQAFWAVVRTRDLRKWVLVPEAAPEMSVRLDDLPLE